MRSNLERFNRRLQRRHPKVRMRWSDVRQLYVLEERVGKTRPLDPALFAAGALDTFIQHRDGYETIEFFRQLPTVRRLIDALEASRITHLMTAAGVRDAGAWADRMDDEDAAVRASARRTFHTIVEGAASEAYDEAMWRTGSRAGGHLPTPRGA